jgi:hypothetical protein
MGIYIFGVSAFDPVDHKVWGLGGNGAGYTAYWSIGTSGANLGVVNSYAANQSFGHWGGWACVAPDLRILVAGDVYRGTICVLNLTNATWTQVSNVTGTGFFEGGSGGVYLSGSKRIAVGLPRDLGRTIYWLQIPTTSGGAYNPAGQWVWTSTTPTGPEMTETTRNSGAYTKWNIVEDMGNGQSAIVYVGHINGPTYVYKVPVSTSAAEPRLPQAFRLNSKSTMPDAVYDISGHRVKATCRSGVYLYRVQGKVEKRLHLR